MSREPQGSAKTLRGGTQDRSSTATSRQSERDDTERDETERDEIEHDETERDGTERDETEAERADRNFNELLQELRVTQMGVQILFAFLLTLAFQGSFADVTPGQLAVYVVTLLLCACSTALLIAPVALHRRLYGQGRKRRVVEVAAKLAQGGLLTLFLAICGAILFILDFILSRTLAISLSVGVTVVFVALWYVMPWSLSRSG